MASISRAVGLIAVSIVLAFLLHYFDNQAIAEMYSTPPDAYSLSQLEDHRHGLIFVFFEALILGAFYLTAVELVAFVTRKIIRRYIISKDAKLRRSLLIYYSVVRLPEVAYP